MAEHAAPGGLLPPVHGQPPAWSEVRQPLCDALEWFRCTQGGSYHHDGLTYGIFMDADSGSRAYIDEEVVITRIGGGCDKAPDGTLILKKDRTLEDAIPRCLKGSMDQNEAVGVIIGDKNTVLGRQLPHRFNVMAWFRVTDIWFEMIGDKKGLKCRLQKLDLAAKSWWAARDSCDPIPPSQRNFGIRPDSIQCLHCHGESPRIYDEGWICLEPSCSMFWKLNGNGAAPTRLNFHSTFLDYRIDPTTNPSPRYELTPTHLQVINALVRNTIREAWRGIICPLCSNCIPRAYWRGWKCTEGCGFQVMLTLNPISIAQVTSVSLRRAIRPNKLLMAPVINDRSAAPYRQLTYNIPNVGSITHFVANREIARRPNGPDHLFQRLQQIDLGLKRFPLKQSQVSGTLMSHFAVNYGTPYKYVVEVDTKGFNEASDDVLRALGRLAWATEKAVTYAGDECKIPNELLILGYFESMKIGFHDDGEYGLGPDIATLSLGAKSEMKIRMKKPWFDGYRKTGKPIKDDPVLAGCKYEQERCALKEEYEAGNISEAEYDDARVAVFKEKNKKMDGKAQAPVIISMALEHGDMVVMHGRKLQDYYEHSVIPNGTMRFALTARNITPLEGVDNGVRQAEARITSDLRYDGL